MRTKISEFSATPGDNTDIDGIDIAEGCAPSGINNAIRELMAQLKDMQTGASGDTFTLTTVNSTTVDTTNLEATNLKAKDGTAAGSIADSTGVVTLGSSVLTTTDINGGTVDGTTIGASVPSTVVATQVDITAQGDLRLQDTTGGQYVALQAPSTVATSYTLTLPVDDGTSGQALVTDGSGVLSWSSAASGDVYGPASATDNAVARYDGTTGKIIQNSAVTIADDGATVIAVNSSSDGLRITQTGAGNALLVEDSANPDATPFVITNDGFVNIGTLTTQLFRSNFYGALNIVGTGYSPSSSLHFGRFNAGTGGAGIEFNHSRSGTVGTNTVLQSGDILGQVLFNGADGTSYITGAQVTAEVDGTPGTNDMPGRLVFSTTADGASSPTERMRISSAGGVGIGATPSADISFIVGKNITGGTTSYGIAESGTVQSDVTTAANMFLSNPKTVASAFTLGNLFHYNTIQGTKGAGSTITNQFGFYADSSLTGATNNYGFYGNIASGTGRWNFYAAGTAANYFAGNVGVGTTTNSGKLDVTGGNVYNNTTATGSTGYYTNNGTRVNAFSSDFNANATYLDVNGNAYFRDVNAGYVTRLAIQSGTISLGAAPGAESLRVTPVASAVNWVQVSGNTAGAGVSILAEGSDTNIPLNLTSKGNNAVAFYTNHYGSLGLAVAHTASAVNYLQVTGAPTSNTPYFQATGSDANVGMNFSTKGSNGYAFYTNGFTPQFVVGHTASAVNYLQVTGAATGGVPLLQTTGSDTNVPLTIVTKGTGYINLQTGGGTQFVVSNTASAVNYLQATGSATGNATTLSAAGSDTNIDLALTPKGTGKVRFGTLTATSDVAITGYIEVKDSAGNVRKLAVIT